MCLSCGVSFNLMDSESEKGKEKELCTGSLINVSQSV
jgi:hypothetical protein